MTTYRPITMRAPTASGRFLYAVLVLGGPDGDRLLTDSEGRMVTFPTRTAAKAFIAELQRLHQQHAPTA